MPENAGLNPNLTFLKLGGSLITDKAAVSTPRLEIIARIAAEIKATMDNDPAMQLLLGHGSGSFGHVPAKQHGTRQGVSDAAGWRGFAEVWYQASALDRLVVEALAAAGLPVLAFPPSANVSTQDGQVAAWDLAPMKQALEHGLLPLVYGDVVFDRARGGTILSTEDLFAYLARQLNPGLILLAGIEPGVWADYPDCNQLAAEITPLSLPQAAPALAGSAATDVTGGMAAKVHEMLALAQAIPGLEVRIFSGHAAGSIQFALQGEPLGTLIHA